jgi:hypothetical protein
MRCNSDDSGDQEKKDFAWHNVAVLSGGLVGG